MLICLNDNGILDAANELLQWDHAAGKVSDGLETRREVERSLFLRYLVRCFESVTKSSLKMVLGMHCFH